MDRSKKAFCWSRGSSREEDIFAMSDLSFTGSVLNDGEHFRPGVDIGTMSPFEKDVHMSTNFFQSSICLNGHENIDKIENGMMDSNHYRLEDQIRDVITASSIPALGYGPFIGRDRKKNLDHYYVGGVGDMSFSSCSSGGNLGNQEARSSSVKRGSQNNMSKNSIFFRLFDRGRQSFEMLENSSPDKHQILNLDNSLQKSDVDMVFNEEFLLSVQTDQIAHKPSFNPRQASLFRKFRSMGSSELFGASNDAPILPPPVMEPIFSSNQLNSGAGDFLSLPTVMESAAELLEHQNSGGLEDIIKFTNNLDLSNSSSTKISQTHQQLHNTKQEFTKTQHLAQTSELIQLPVIIESNPESATQSVELMTVSSCESTEFTPLYGKRVHKFTKDEDSKLMKLVELHGKKWGTIVNEFGEHVTAAKLRERYKRIKPGRQKGRWTEEEDNLLRMFYEKYPKKWTQISTHIKGRTGKQVRDRWEDSLDPAIKKDPFSMDEDKKILEIFDSIGPKWKEIAALMPGRSGNNVKNRYNSFLKKVKEGKATLQDGQLPQSSSATNMTENDGSIGAAPKTKRRSKMKEISEENEEDMEDSQSSEEASYLNDKQMDDILMGKSNHKKQTKSYLSVPTQSSTPSGTSSGLISFQSKTIYSTNQSSPTGQMNHLSIPQSSLNERIFKKKSEEGEKLKLFAHLDSGEMQVFSETYCSNQPMEETVITSSHSNPQELFKWDNDVYAQRPLANRTLSQGAMPLSKGKRQEQKFPHHP